MFILVCKVTINNVYISLEVNTVKFNSNNNIRVNVETNH